MNKVIRTPLALQVDQVWLSTLPSSWAHKTVVLVVLESQSSIGNVETQTFHVKDGYCYNW